MLTKTQTCLLGYFIWIDEGTFTKPRWWHILIRLGLRRRKLFYVTPKGSVLLSEINNVMTVRREDFQALISDPKMFVMLEGLPG